MLVIKKELSFYEFVDLFGYVLEDIGREGQSIIFDAVCDMFYEGTDETTIRDYLRYTVRVASLDEVINDYGYMMELEGLEGDALVETVADYLNYNYFLGSFKEDGETFFIFDEF